MKALKRLLNVVGKNDVVVSVVLTDDRSIQLLNHKWRKKDKPTDVLSWPLYEPEEIALVREGKALVREGEIGDVVISVETAVRQARGRGWELCEELALLLIHGTLHLLGHEDDTENGSHGMREIERAILGKPLDYLEI